MHHEKCGGGAVNDRAQLHGKSASCRTLPSMPAPRTASIASHAAELTAHRQNFCARIWCVMRAHAMSEYEDRL
jgi:hypothetical protein